MRVIRGEWQDPCLCQFIGLSTALAISAGTSLIGSAIQAGAASSAADTQAQAGIQASQNALAASQAAAGRLQPFTNLGTGAAGALSYLTGTAKGTNPLTAPLTAPFTPADLSQTPGYKFTLDQGLQATQSGFAAQGLGRSGAALKGAANYATGLAQSTYNQQLSNYLAQNQQIYNMLAGQSSLGENAAAGQGNLGVQGTNFANQFLTSAAASQAAGTVGVGNAISGGLSNVGGNALVGALLNKQQANPIFDPNSRFFGAGA